MFLCKRLTNEQRLLLHQAGRPRVAKKQPEQAVVMWVGWETPELHMLESWEVEKQRINKVNQDVLLNSPVFGKYFCSDFDIANMIKSFCSHCNLPLDKYFS